MCVCVCVWMCVRMNEIVGGPYDFSFKLDFFPFLISCILFGCVVVVNTVCGDGCKIKALS